MSFTGTPASRSLALLVAVALLLSTAFRVFHLFPADRAPTPELAAAHEVILGEAGSAHEVSADQSVGEEYFAVLVVILLALLLGPLLRRTGPWHGHAVPRTYSGLRVRLWVAHLARGPTGPLLQVFRL